jgi:hypothetical protein
MLMLSFERVKITNGGALLYGTSTGNTPRLGQQGLNQCGFARRAVSNQGNITDRFGGVPDHH